MKESSRGREESGEMQGEEPIKEARSDREYPRKRRRGRRRRKGTGRRGGKKRTRKSHTGPTKEEIGVQETKRKKF